MAQLARLVDTMPGLHLIGNSYHGVGLPEMVRQGSDTARAIAAT